MRVFSDDVYKLWTFKLAWENTFFSMEKIHFCIKTIYISNLKICKLPRLSDAEKF